MEECNNNLGIFTVLHYGSDKATEECLCSLMQLRRINECRIVILDNGSGTDIKNIVKNKYGQYAAIEVISSEKNLGFSGGNNVLYKRAKTYRPNFIAVLNNDIVIKQRNFIDRLVSVLEQNKYYFIGPDVYKPSALEHQSPLCKGFPSMEELETGISYWVKISNGRTREPGRLKKYVNSIKYRICPEKLAEIYKMKKYGPDSLQNWYLNEYENPVLQGSCIIATEKYIQNEDVLFEPDTGFYFEEHLLALKCRTKNYLTLYTPELKVIHKHGVAARSSCKNNSEYLVEQAERNIRAYEILKETIAENPWKK